MNNNTPPNDSTPPVSYTLISARRLNPKTLISDLFYLRHAAIEWLKEHPNAVNRPAVEEACANTRNYDGCMEGVDDGDDADADGNADGASQTTSRDRVKESG